jgi:hypothetical protein
VARRHVAIGSIERLVNKACLLAFKWKARKTGTEREKHRKSCRVSNHKISSANRPVPWICNIFWASESMRDWSKYLNKVVLGFRSSWVRILKGFLSLPSLIQSRSKPSPLFDANLSNWERREIKYKTISWLFISSENKRFRWIFPPVYWVDYHHANKYTRRTYHNSKQRNWSHRKQTTCKKPNNDGTANSLRYTCIYKRSKTTTQAKTQQRIRTVKPLSIIHSVLSVTS